MKLIQIYNYDNRHETIRADQIESVVEPSGRVHDNGAVVLLGGRRIALGQSMDQHRRIIRELSEA